IYKIKGKLKRTSSVASLTAFKIGRTFHLFGHNPPPASVDPTASVQSTSTSSTTSGVTTTTQTSPGVRQKKTAFSKWLNASTPSYDPAVEYGSVTNTARTVIPALAERDF